MKVRALQAQLLTAVRSNRILRSRVERLEEREMPGTRREADVGSEHSACRPSSAGDSHAGTASSTEALPSYAESDPPSPRLLFTDGDAAHPAVPTRVSLQRRALNSNHAATAAAATVAIAKAAAAQPLSNYCARACRSAASVRSSDGDGDGTMSSKAVASEASSSREAWRRRSVADRYAAEQRRAAETRATARNKQSELRRKDSLIASLKAALAASESEAASAVAAAERALDDALARTEAEVGLARELATLESRAELEAAAAAVDELRAQATALLSPSASLPGAAERSATLTPRLTPHVAEGGHASAAGGRLRAAVDSLGAVLGAVSAAVSLSVAPPTPSPAGEAIGEARLVRLVEERSLDASCDASIEFHLSSARTQLNELLGESRGAGGSESAAGSAGGTLHATQPAGGGGGAEAADPNLESSPPSLSLAPMLPLQSHGADLLRKLLLARGAALCCAAAAPRALSVSHVWGKWVRAAAAIGAEEGAVRREVAVRFREERLRRAEKIVSAGAGRPPLRISAEEESEAEQEVVRLRLKLSRAAAREASAREITAAAVAAREGELQSEAAATVAALKEEHGVALKSAARAAQAAASEAAAAAKAAGEAADAAAEEVAQERAERELQCSQRPANATATAAATEATAVASALARRATAEGEARLREERARHAAQLAETEARLAAAEARVAAAEHAASAAAAAADAAAERDAYRAEAAAEAEAEATSAAATMERAASVATVGLLTSELREADATRSRWAALAEARRQHVEQLALDMRREALPRSSSVLEMRRRGGDEPGLGRGGASSAASEEASGGGEEGVEEADARGGSPLAVTADRVANVAQALRAEMDAEGLAHGERLADVAAATGELAAAVRRDAEALREAGGRLAISRNAASSSALPDEGVGVMRRLRSDEGFMNEYDEDQEHPQIRALPEHEAAARPSAPAHSRSPHLFPPLSFSAGGVDLDEDEVSEKDTSEEEEEEEELSAEAPRRVRQRAEAKAAARESFVEVARDSATEERWATGSRPHSWGASRLDEDSVGGTAETASMCLASPMASGSASPTESRPWHAEPARSSWLGLAGAPLEHQPFGSLSVDAGSLSAVDEVTEGSFTSHPVSCSDMSEASEASDASASPHASPRGKVTSLGEGPAATPEGPLATATFAVAVATYRRALCEADECLAASESERACLTRAAAGAADRDAECKRLGAELADVSATAIAMESILRSEVSASEAAQLAAETDAAHREALATAKVEEAELAAAQAAAQAAVRAAEAAAQLRASERARQAAELRASAAEGAEADAVAQLESATAAAAAAAAEPVACEVGAAGQAGGSSGDESQDESDRRLAAAATRARGRTASSLPATTATAGATRDADLPKGETENETAEANGELDTEGEAEAAAEEGEAEAGAEAEGEAEGGAPPRGAGPASEGAERLLAGGGAWGTVEGGGA